MSTRKNPILPNSKAATLADVARRAGVTKSTASFAFSGKRKISDATKKRVFAVARELGYKPNPHAQRLGAGRAAKLVGLFALTLDHMAWKTMSQLHHDLAAEGYEAPLYTYGYSLEGPPDHEALLFTMCSQLPEGIICNTAKLILKDCRILEEYQRKGGALVCMHSELPLACDQVIFDRNQNTYLAAHYLLQAGHRDIGFCMFDAADFSLPRSLGFLRALQEYGVKPNPRWLFEAGHDEEGGAILAEKFLKLKKRPSALCIVNDMQAATFVHKMLRAGVRVPEDVSVISLDDMPAARHGMVALTAVTQPWAEMAGVSVQFLLQRMQKTAPPEPRKVIYAGEIIERESVLRL
jgi:LacI family transcriptional regulator